MRRCPRSRRRISFKRFAPGDGASIVIDLGPRFASFRTSELPGDRGPAASSSTSSPRPATTAPGAPAPAPPVSPPPASSPAAAARPGADRRHPHDRHRRRPRRHRRRRAWAWRHARKERDAQRRAAAEGGARGAARRARDPDARRRCDSRPRRARGARQQQQGGSLRQPARQRLGPHVGVRRRGLLPEPRGVRRPGAAGGQGRDRGACRSSAAARATSRSSSGRWRRRATSSSRRRSRKAVEAALRERVPMSPRAIQQAPFRVLVGANMPAVLVEMGFITNADQEKQLGSEAFQTSIVQALVDSIIRYRDRVAGPQPAGVPRRRRGRVAAPTLMSRRAWRLASPSCWRSPAAWWLIATVARGMAPPDRPDARRIQPARQPAATRARSPRRSTTSPKTACRSSASSGRCRSARPSLEQARQIVEAQLATAPPPLVSAIPADTKLRGAVHHRARRRVRRPERRRHGPGTPAARSTSSSRSTRSSTRSRRTCRRSSACRCSSTARRSTRSPATSTCGIRCRRT